MGSHPWPGYLRRVAPLMGALAGMIPWGKIAALVGAMLVGGFLMHKLDKGVIEHKNVEIAQLKLDHQKAVNDALVWATEKQKVYDNAAVQSAQRMLRDNSSSRLTHPSAHALFRAFPLVCLFAAALLTSSCASSTQPLSPQGRQAPFPSPPENLLTPARPLTPLLWCDGCSVS
jgi:hypothetical protein